MPRRKEPVRQVSIAISDENVRDAIVLWVQKYHGIELDIKQIELNVTDGRVMATAVQKPRKEAENEPVQHPSTEENGVSSEPPCF